MSLMEMQTNPITDATRDDEALSRRRRAIARGLELLLTPDQFLEAMCLWEDRFSRGATFALVEFVNEVRKLDGVAAGRKVLHQSLVRSIILPPERLGTDPLPEMRQYRRTRAGIPGDWETVTV